MPALDDELRDLADELSRGVDTSNTFDGVRRKAMHRHRARPVRTAGLIVTAIVISIVGFVPIYLAFRGATPASPASSPASAPGSSPPIPPFSIEGSFALVGGRAGSVGGLFVMRADGHPRQIARRVGLNPSWSPDGTKVLMIRSIPRTEGGTELVIVDVASHRVSALTRHELPGPGAWSPTGDAIAFPTGYGDLYLVHPDGTGLTQLTSPGGNCADYSGISWSPDASQIAFGRECEGRGDVGLYVMNADGSNLHRLTSNPRVLDTAWSPDGGTLAFSEFTGPDIAVRLINVDGTGERVLTSNGESPTWAPNGDAIAVVKSGRVVILDRDGKRLTTLEGASGLYVDHASWSRVVV